MNSAEKAGKANLWKGQKTALVAASVTLALACTKAFAGYFFHSPLLAADGFHTLSDFTVIFASWFGLWLASRKKTDRFPYGLYKAETLVSFLIGIFIGWAGIEILLEGIRKLTVFAVPQAFPLVPIIVSCISMAVGFFLAHIEYDVGREINSQSLKAIAKDSYLNIAVSAAVLIGIVAAYFSVPYIESALLLVISFLILKLGIETIWYSLLILLDANLDHRLQMEIYESVLSMNGITAVNNVKIRQAGPFRLVECNIQSNPKAPLYKTHDLADRVENFITSNFPNIESVLIHMEPARGNEVLAIIPVKDINGLDSRIHGHFGRAPYFIILRIEKENVQIEDFYANEFLKEEENIHIGIKVIKAVIKYGFNALFTSQIGEISFHMLKDNFVDIYRVQENETIHEVTRRYMEGKLESLNTPTHVVEASQAGQKRARG
ncbi:MAG: cation diffusion facilitator family transporter [Deltaproteobacteria bacterium]|nr:cation diffusion facilitator family transporter [Deltaproteobacteria bacterium]